MDIQNCILPFLEIKELYSMSLTCKYLFQYILEYYGKIYILPNEVLYISRSPTEVLYMTNTGKCVIEGRHPNLLYIISQHTRGYQTDPYSYELSDKKNYLLEYLDKDILREYFLTIRGASCRSKCKKFIYKQRPYPIGRIEYPMTFY
jgi:hypothetical protein